MDKACAVNPTPPSGEGVERVSLQEKEKAPRPLGKDCSVSLLLEI